MANKTPVWYDAGFGVYSGDDTIHHNYTEATGNVITLEKGGPGNEVLQVLNKGELKIKSLVDFSAAALTIDARGAQDGFTLNDDENADHLLTIRKVTSGSGWITDFKVRDSGAPSNDDIAFRITHDIQTNSPPLGADLLSVGYTNASVVYQELFRFKQSGDFYMVGSSGADILWATTGGGNIGGSGGNSPDYVYGNTAIVGGGTTVKAQTLELGPIAANTKLITALQTGTNDPGIRYNSSSSEWELAHDGTTWVKINTGAGNDLDQAYDAFGGVGQVDINGGTLTWRVTSPYNFVVDDGTTTFLNIGRIGGVDGKVAIGTTGANSTIGITSTGLNGDITISSAGSSAPIAISSGSSMAISAANSGGITITGAGSSSFTTPSGYLTLNASSSTARLYGAHIAIDAQGASGAVTIDSTYNTTITAGRQLGLNAGAGYDLALYVANNGSSDISFDAHGSGVVYFNSSTDPTLNTTKKNIVGAINELASGIGAITWDDIYDNATSLVIDSSTLVFSQTSTSGIGFKVDRGLGSASTDAPIMQVFNVPTVTTDDQPGFQSYYRDDLGMAGDTVKSLEAAFESASGVSGGMVKLFNTKLVLNAGDSGATLYGYFADGDTTGSWTSYGFYADADWDYGIYSLAQGKIDFTTAGDQVVFEVEATTPGSSTHSISNIHSIINAGASASGTYYAFAASLTGTTSGSTYAYYCEDTSFDYGLYSTVKSAIDLNNVVASVDAFTADVASGGLTGSPTVKLVKANYAGHASDIGTTLIYGVSAEADTTGGATKEAFYANANWAHSLYALSPAYVDVTPGSATAGNYNVNYGSYNASGAALGATSSVQVYHASISPNASDNGNAYYIAFYANGDTTGSATKIAFFADADWDYGIYTSTRALISITPSSAAGAQFNVTDSRYSANSAALGASDSVVNYYATITPNAGDNASAEYYAFYADGSATGSATKYGVYVDEYWDYGISSLSKASISSKAVNGVGASGHWSTYSQVTPATTLASNDEVSAFTADILDNVGDSGAYYYGLYIKTSDNGPAAKWGIHIDTTWPADHRALSIRSGLNYFQEDFGTVTSNTDHFDINLEGLLNSAIGGRCLNLDISPDPGQADGSSWYGVRANMANANANDTVGSFAFHANDNWHYAFYADNDLSKQQAPGEGVLHVESDSSSAVGSGSYYGYSYYHTRHASDTAGALTAFYAQANSATGSLSVCALQAGNACNYGVLSSAGTNVFQRLTGEWGALSAAVVNVSNGNSSSTAPALFVGSLNTGSSGKCIEISHAYNGGDTEDTRRAIVFTSAQTNVRQVPTSMFQENMTNTTTSYWQYQCTTTAQRWYTLGTAARAIAIPLTVPHNSVIKKVEVVCYHQNVPTTGSIVTLYRHPVDAGSPSISTSLGSQSGALSSGTQTVTLTGLSVTVDNTQYSYYAQFYNGVTAASSASYLYIARVTYEITDFAAACGW